MYFVVIIITIIIITIIIIIIITVLLLLLKYIRIHKTNELDIVISINNLKLF